MTIDELIARLAPYPGDWEVIYDAAEIGAPRTADSVCPGISYIRNGSVLGWKAREDGKYMECNSVFLV